jgi:tetrahydromethanopterin S-methyltransferase subunit A
MTDADDDEALLYPWSGDFVTGAQDSPVAVVTLSGKLKLPMEKIAIAGPMKTENLGVEKVVANVISNPRIRFLIVAGEEVRGHRSGDTIKALHASGVDDKGRVIGSKGAVPFIENLNGEAIDRFISQVELVDMLGVTDVGAIGSMVDELTARDPGSFGEPYMAIQFTEGGKGGGLASVSGSLALHRDILVDPYGEVTPFEMDRGGEGDGDGLGDEPERTESDEEAERDA